MAHDLPDPVVKRLPLYHRYLKDVENQGVCYISSAELAALSGLTASQVRQDCSVFGGEGRQGCGYPVKELLRHVEALLGIHAPHTMIIVGAGNLGRAIASCESFRAKHFTTIAAFDVSKRKIGTRIGEMTIRNADEMERFLQNAHVDIAVLTLPAEATPEMAQRIYRCGVRGFWNYAPLDLQLPSDAAVVNVHLDESLELLSYRLHHCSL